jgi:hypothetical protein
MESIHRAAAFQKKTAIGDSVYNFLDGSALIAFGIILFWILLSEVS